MVGIEKYKDYKSNQSSINKNNQDFLSLLDLFGSRYIYIQQNIVLIGLGICIQDIFNAIQKGYKQARAEQNKTILEMKIILLNSICSLDMDRRNQENIVYTSLGIYILRDIFKAVQKGYKQARVE